MVVGLLKIQRSYEQVASNLHSRGTSPIGEFLFHVPLSKFPRATTMGEFSLKFSFCIFRLDICTGLQQLGAYAMYSGQFGKSAIFARAVIAYVEKQSTDMQ
jgi:hypothetical protein